MVRRIEFDTPTIGNWAAFDEAMVNQFYEGTFEPTVAIFDWSTDPPSLSIGAHEDGDMIRADLARQRGYHVARRYGYGGSVGVYGPAIGLFTLYFDAEGRDVSLDSLSRTSGEAIVDTLTEYGIDAVYDHIGDVKFIIDNKQYKAVANAPVRLHETDLWAITISVIWGGLPEKLQEVLDEAVRVPPEKFEDKDEKTVTGRMKPLSLEFDQFGTEVTKEELLDELIERNVAAVLENPDSLSNASLESALDYVEATTPFYESDTWVNKRATSRMCNRWNEDDTIGVASYKSRKLVKASLILDGTTIEDALVTGDFFVRPHPTVTGDGAPSDLDDAIVGLDVTDNDALREAVTGVFEDPSFEMPGVSAEDIVETITHAAENTMSVEAYLDDHA